MFKKTIKAANFSRQETEIGCSGGLGRGSYAVFAQQSTARVGGVSWFRPLRGLVLILLLMEFGWAGGALADADQLATESAGFDMVGFIQAATIDHPIGTAGDLLSGGTIRVNGHVIIVPANSIVQMPAATLSWGQIFAQAPANLSNIGTATGLALDDCLPPVGLGSGCQSGTWEAHVQGNIVASSVCMLHSD